VYKLWIPNLIEETRRWRSDCCSQTAQNEQKHAVCLEAKVVARALHDVHDGFDVAGNAALMKPWIRFPRPTLKLSSLFVALSALSLVALL
jgi:hypothetical protein